MTDKTYGQAMSPTDNITSIRVRRSTARRLGVERMKYNELALEENWCGNHNDFIVKLIELHEDKERKNTGGTTQVG